MSFSLATIVSEEIARAKRIAVPQPEQVMMIRSASGLDSTPQGGQIVEGAVAAGLAAGAVTLVLLVPLYLLGIYLEWLRFRDGTKLERIGQVGAIVGRIVVIPAEYAAITADEDPATWARVVLGLSSAVDGAAAVHQIARGEHYIANGLAIAGDATSLGAAAFGPMIRSSMRAKGLLPGQQPQPLTPSPGSQIAALGVGSG